MSRMQHPSSHPLVTRDVEERDHFAGRKAKHCKYQMSGQSLASTSAVLLQERLPRHCNEYEEVQEHGNL